MAESEAAGSTWEESCPACSGVGKLAPPSRETWLQTRQSLELQRRAAAGVVEAAIFEDRLAQHADQEPDEPELIACSACHGRGLVPTVQGQYLLDFLRRHGHRF